MGDKFFSDSRLVLSSRVAVVRATWPYNRPFLNKWRGRGFLEVVRADLLQFVWKRAIVRSKLLVLELV